MLLKHILTNNMSASKTALKFQNRNVSYYELNHKCKIISDKLNEADLGNNIGIFLPNSIQYVVAYFSAAFLDKVIVPIGIQAKESEIVGTASYCELRTIISDTYHMEFLKKIFKAADFKIVFFDINTEEFYILNEHKPCLMLTENMGGSENDAVALMLHTSGTTSNPKRVMLTHQNLVSNVNSIIRSLSLTEQDTTLIVLPMHLAAANTSQLLTHIFLGATIVIYEGLFLPNSFFDFAEQTQATNMTCVPFMLRSILSYRGNKDKLKSLTKICAGSVLLPTELIRAFTNAYPDIELIHMYGQTEAGPRISHLMRADSIRKIGSVGKPLEGIELRIVNEQGADCKAFDEGEIIVRGSNVMKGYYKNPEATAKALKDGWLYTGDIACFDEDGYVYLKGRRKNIIITGGYNIYPEEIEEVLLSHRAISEAYVYGVKSDLYDELPEAMIVCEKTLDLNELYYYCKQRLSPFKIPHRFILTDDIPKTQTGKIKRI